MEHRFRHALRVLRLRLCGVGRIGQGTDQCPPVRVAVSDIQNGKNRRQNRQVAPGQDPPHHVLSLALSRVFALGLTPGLTLGLGLGLSPALGLIPEQKLRQRRLRFPVPEIHQELIGSLCRR